MKTQYEINESDYRNLSDSELFYKLTGNATYAQLLAERMYSSYNENITRTDLLEIPNIGNKTADSILMAMEIGRRTIIKEKPEKVTIRTSADAHKLMQNIFWGLENEEFWIVLVNIANVVLKKVRVAIGGTTFCTCDIKIILNEIIKSKAHGLFVYHNHPSGNLMSSIHDDKLTETLKNACKMIDSVLLDHIIITNSGYYSYADEGKL